VGELETAVLRAGKTVDTADRQLAKANERVAELEADCKSWQDKAVEIAERHNESRSRELELEAKVAELEHSLSDAMEQIAAIQGTNAVYMERVAELERYDERKAEQQVHLEQFHADHQDDAFGVERVRELEAKLEMSEKTHQWQIGEMQNRSIRIIELEGDVARLEVIVRDYGEGATQKPRPMDEEPAYGVWVWTVKKYRFGSRPESPEITNWYDKEGYQLHGEVEGWIPCPPDTEEVG
jgi:chromosome segregation ATPase